MLAYGDIPDHANDYSATEPHDAAGAIINGNLERCTPVDLRDPEQIQEFVPHSWYKYPDESKGLHPWDGVTEPQLSCSVRTPKARSTNIERDRRRREIFLDQGAALAGHAMEVGPLARYIVGYAQGHAEIKNRSTRRSARLDVPVDALFSTLGRTAARALEAQWAARKQKYFLDKLIANIKAGDSSTANTEKFDPKTWPAEVKGVGFTEAPRGALGALDQDQGHAHRKLPVRGSDDLERIAARSCQATSAPSRHR